MSEMLSAADASTRWAEQRQLPVMNEMETGSTNANAKANALGEEADFVLYLAAHQTQGRGRGANTWLDTGVGEALLGTWSFAIPAAPQAITGPRIGLALHAAVQRAWPTLAWSLKAPNDLYLNGLKVAGLLVETVSDGAKFRLLIGLGMNITNHPRRFQNATHLADALGVRPDEAEWFRFLDELHAQFQLALDDVMAAQLSEVARVDLARALNANSAKTKTVSEVSALGDLIYSDGRVKWTDL
ncbi:MAG TPA: hypothetical protein PKC28_00955 [Bdellovibrionales bacterium]|nr:hypothetical protein [Bdellovibrionales bacterium]